MLFTLCVYTFCCVQPRFHIPGDVLKLINMFPVSFSHYYDHTFQKFYIVIELCNWNCLIDISADMIRVMIILKWMNYWFIITNKAFNY